MLKAGILQDLEFSLQPYTAHSPDDRLLTRTSEEPNAQIRLPSEPNLIYSIFFLLPYAICRLCECFIKIKNGPVSAGQNRAMITPLSRRSALRCQACIT